MKSVNKRILLIYLRFIFVNAYIDSKNDKGKNNKMLFIVEKIQFVNIVSFI